ncbi:MAG: hypothetical protein ACIARR_10775 [Phycisphaerales bacterium JB059]
MGRTASRRAWNGVLLVVFTLATGASMLLVGLLADRHSFRVDLSLTGAHRLSERTTRTLAQLTGEYEIVAAFDRARTPRAIGDRVLDVLEEISQRSEGVRLTTIDVSSSTGVAQLDELSARLALRDAPTIETQRRVLGTAFGELERLAGELDALSPALQRIGAQIPEEAPGSANNRAFFEQQSAVARVAGRELRTLVESVRTRLESDELAFDAQGMGQTLAAALATLASQQGALSDQLAAFSEAEIIPPEARASARPLARATRARRDELAVLGDELGRLDRPDSVRVARALERNQALLVIGPPGEGVAAVDLDLILPTTVAAFESTGISAAATIARRTEELVTSAIGSLASPVRPIVVVTHGERARGLSMDGVFAPMSDRLSQRGIDVVEWAAAVEPDPPDLVALDPSAERPRVYLVINTNSAVAARAEGEAGGSQRAQALGRAIDRLVEQGESVLVSLNPSVFPTYGDTDPTGRALEQFGIKALTGRPLLRRVVGERGVMVGSELRPVASLGEHAIAEAIFGLEIRLPWAIPMELEEGATPLLAVEDTPSLWGESQWGLLWQTPAAEHALLPDQPEPGGERDLESDRWVVAACGTRAHETTGRTQRIVAIGSNGWLVRDVAGSPRVVDGRIVAPGNLELLEASVLWLAGQDELIAQSAQADAISLIKPMSSTGRRTLGWSLIGGLPLVILLFGLGWRLARG